MNWPQNVTLHEKAKRTSTLPEVQPLLEMPLAMTLLTRAALECARLAQSNTLTESLVRTPLQA